MLECRNSQGIWYFRLSRILRIHCYIGVYGGLLGDMRGRHREIKEVHGEHAGTTRRYLGMKSVGFSNSERSRT